MAAAVVVMVVVVVGVVVMVVEVVQSPTHKLICVSHFREHVVSKGTIFSLNVNVQEQAMCPCVTMHTEKQSTQIFI